MSMDAERERTTHTRLALHSIDDDTVQGRTADIIDRRETANVAERALGR